MHFHTTAGPPPPTAAAAQRKGLRTAKALPSGCSLSLHREFFQHDAILANLLAEQELTDLEENGHVLARPSLSTFRLSQC
jgi:hypothetical protein